MVPLLTACRDYDGDYRLPQWCSLDRLQQCLSTWCEKSECVWGSCRMDAWARIHRARISRSQQHIRHAHRRLIRHRMSVLLERSAPQITDLRYCWRRSYAPIFSLLWPSWIWIPLCSLFATLTVYESQNSVCETGVGEFFYGRHILAPRRILLRNMHQSEILTHPYRRPFGLNVHGKHSRIGVRAVAIFCLDIAFSWLYRGPDCLHGREFWMFFPPAFLLTSVWPEY
jgi:hypothetical protein